MKRKTLFLFLFGCAAYPSVETAYRGFTHYSMCLAGGLCVCFAVYCCEKLPARLPLRCFTGGMVITAIEFIFGVIFNLILRMNVWDYSDEAFNLLGQVCPKLTLAWMVLTVSILGASHLLDRSEYLRQRITLSVPRLNFQKSCGRSRS